MILCALPKEYTPIRILLSGFCFNEVIIFLISSEGSGWQKIGSPNVASVIKVLVLISSNFWAVASGIVLKSPVTKTL